MTRRDEILRLALELMAGAGAASMSMRELAEAAGMNVATLYHYFPSKRELLTAVLEDPRYRDVLAAELPDAHRDDTTAALAQLLAESWQAMTQVDDYVRVMLGEAMRGDDAARGGGAELLQTTETSLRAWVEDALHLSGDAAGQVAKVLRAVIIGVFIEELASDERPDAAAFERRGEELAAALVALAAPPPPSRKGRRGMVG